MTSLVDIVPPGVVTGDNLLKLLTHAKDTGYAIPAFNCTRYVCVGGGVLAPAESVMDRACFKSLAVYETTETEEV